MIHKYLIFAGHHAAVIDIPSELTSDEYGLIQDWFAKRTGGDTYSSMRRLRSDDQQCGVYYHDELAGPNGASFELFQFPDTPEDDVKRAEEAIRHKFDVVSLRVRRFKKLYEVQPDVDDLILKTRSEWRCIVAPNTQMADFHIVDSKGNVIAEVAGSFAGIDSVEQNRKNGKLMAMSPVLLKSLHRALDGLHAAFPHADRIRDILAPIIAETQETLAAVNGGEA